MNARRAVSVFLCFGDPLRHGRQEAHVRVFNCRLPTTYSTCLPGAVSHSQGCRTRAQPQALSSRPSMHGGDREFEMARAAPAWSLRGRIPAWSSLLQHTYLWSRLSSRSCRHGSPRPTPCIHAHCPRAPHLRACCGRVSTSCPSSSTDPSARDPLRARARRRGSTI